MIAFTVISIILILSIIIENLCIFTTHIKLAHKNCPSELETKKIAFISDLHINKSLFSAKRVVRIIKAQRPDYIFISGDFVSRHIKDISLAEQVLNELCKIARVYACVGNHELDLNNDLYRQLCNAFEESGAVLLDDKSEMLFENTHIYGVSCKRECYVNQNGRYTNLAQYNLEDMQNAIPKNQGFSIVLAHNPLFFEAYEKWGADIALCGHIHGGSVRIPFLCGLLSPERKFFPKYSSGKYTKNNTVMFVGRGIAKPRIFCPKHIVMINFSKSE